MNQESKPRKLIEAMKELNLLLKRMETNTHRINQYASLVSTERPVFGTEAEQSQEVSRLIQANMDLADNYLNIKRSIDLTNLQTRVAFDGREYTISDLLVLKRKLQTMILGTYQALNDNVAVARAHQLVRVSGDPAVQVVRCYDESRKHKELERWQTMFHEVDSRLEVVNATTDLITE